ncbi:MAG: RluA family pseudouridine synthase [Pseudomonadota bacterium]
MTGPAPSTPTLLQFVVDADGNGARLDRFLAERAQGLSRARVQALIEAGQVRIEGTLARASRRVTAGQQIHVEIPALRPARPRGEDIALVVLHEDADIIVVDKAPGMVVHPAPGHDGGTLVNALLGRYGAQFSVGGEERPGIVHRLDKGTSGLLVVARHDEALAHLQRQFQDRSVSKRYLAVVHGDPGAGGRVDTPYGRHPRDRKRFSSRVLGASRRAVLEFTCRERLGSCSLLVVALHTGRTHQVRVQLADRGHPLVGDEAYGRRRKDPAFGRPALHAWQLEITHPRTGQRLHFEAALPTDLEELIARLRGEP